MGLIKESELKKMLEYVQAEQMTFSRMVELLNIKIDKDKINKNQWISSLDVVRGIECFLVQNENTEMPTKIKLQVLKNAMLDKAVNDSNEILNK